jgi:predicted esterase
MTTLAAASLLAFAARPVRAAEPVLKAAPSATTTTLKPGVSRLNARSFAYRPKTVAGPPPLIVLLHPAGGNAQEFLSEFKRTADQRGALLLALQATGRTWTLKPDGNGRADFGAEPAALDEALTVLFDQTAIDPKRVAILGFSDGASYALSIGLANPRLFKGVVALSPGTVWLPPGVDSSQRIFIAHGTRDEILPFENARDTIAPGLEKAGLKPQTLWFRGEHEIDDPSVEQALDYVLGK